MHLLVCDLNCGEEFISPWLLGCALSLVVTYGADNTVIDILKSVSFSATNSFTVASEEICSERRCCWHKAEHICALKSMV